MPLWHHLRDSIELGSAGAPDRCWGLRDAKLPVSQCRGAPGAVDDGVHACFYFGTRESPQMQFGCTLGRRPAMPS